MTLRPKNKSAGGLQCPPNHLIVKLWSMKGHPEMGQSQNTEETAIANQLHNCRTSLFAQSQVLHNCLRESVTHLSRCIFVAPSFSRGVKCCKYVYANRCRYVTVTNMSVKCGIYVYANRCPNVTLQKCHVKMYLCHVAQMSHLGPNRSHLGPNRPHLTPPMEKLTMPTPSDGNRENPPREFVTPPMEKLNPPMENDLTLRWKQTRVIRITKGEDE